MLQISIVNFSFVKYLEHGHSIPLQFCEVKAFLKFFRKRGRIGADRSDRAMGKETKTNAMRILERAKVPYTAHEYALSLIHIFHAEP